MAIQNAGCSIRQRREAFSPWAVAGGTHTLLNRPRQDPSSSSPATTSPRRRFCTRAGTATATYGLPLGLFGRVGVRALGVGVAHVLRCVCKYNSRPSHLSPATSRRHRRVVIRTCSVPLQAYILIYSHAQTGPDLLATCKMRARASHVPAGGDRRRRWCSRWSR